MDFINGWVLFGFLGQAAFSARFIVQWIISEKNKKSTIPIAFWYLSHCRRTDFIRLCAL